MFKELQKYIDDLTPKKTIKDIIIFFMAIFFIVLTANLIVFLTICFGAFLFRYDIFESSEQKEIFRNLITMVGALITVVITSFSILIGYISSKKISRENSIHQIHAESEWRKFYTNILDEDHWTENDLNKIQNRLGPRWVKNIDDIRETKGPSFELKKKMVYEINKLRKKAKTNKTVPYNDSFNLRQLIKMLLDNDWRVMRGENTRYSDIKSINAYIDIYNK